MYLWSCHCLFVCKINKSLPQKRTVLQISVPPELWLWLSRCWAQILRQFGEGWRAEAKRRDPLESLALRWLLKGTHICLSVGLSSFYLLQSQQKVTFLWVLYFYIVGKLHIYWISGIIHLKDLSFAWGSLKSMTMSYYLGWPTFLSLFAWGRKGHQKPQKGQKVLLSESRSVELKLRKLLTYNRFILRIEDLWTWSWPWESSRAYY